MSWFVAELERAIGWCGVERPGRAAELLEHQKVCDLNLENKELNRFDLENKDVNEIDLENEWFSRRRAPEVRLKREADSFR